jgi:hypothetical protein
VLLLPAEVDAVLSFDHFQETSLLCSRAGFELLPLCLKNIRFFLATGDAAK